jgi:hypothetical protein
MTIVQCGDTRSGALWRHWQPWTQGQEHCGDTGNLGHKVRSTVETLATLDTRSGAQNEDKQQIIMTQKTKRC